MKKFAIVIISLVFMLAIAQGGAVISNAGTLVGGAYYDADATLVQNNTSFLVKTTDLFGNGIMQFGSRMNIGSDIKSDFGMSLAEGRVLASDSGYYFGTKNTTYEGPSELAVVPICVLEEPSEISTEGSYDCAFCREMESDVHIDVTNGTFGSTMDFGSTLLNHGIAIEGTGSMDASSFMGSIEGVNLTRDHTGDFSDRIKISGYNMTFAREIILSYP